MRNRRTRELYTAIGLSLLVHAGTAYVGTQVGLEGDSARIGNGARNAGAAGDPQMVVDFEPPPPAKAEPPALPKQPAIADALPPPNPEPQKEHEVALGIEGGGPKSETWLGFRPEEATEHSAPLANIDQPALEHNPGQPGEPAAGQPATQPSSNPQPPSATPPTPSDQPPPTPPAPATPPAPTTPPPELAKPDTPQPPEQPKTPPAPVEAREPTEAAPKPRPESPDFATDEADAKLPAAQMGPPAPPADRLTMDGTNPPNDPVRKQEKLETTSPLDGKGKDDRAQEAREAKQGLEGAKASAEEFIGPPIPPTLVAAETTPTPEQAPSTPAPPPSPAPAPPAGPSQKAVPGPMMMSQARPGENADAPAEKSDKQSDPTSTKKPIVVHPGRPIAAEGLDIITRRPEFTRLTRATVWPENPTIRVTFNKSGRVSKADIISSSGSDDVDGPVLSAIYEWTAKGKALTDLPRDPKAGISITVTISLIQ